MKAKDPRRTLKQLDRAFEDVEHDLWDAAGVPNAAPARLDFINALKAKGLDRLDNRDLDLLIWRADTTVGSVKTFKHFLPAFVRAVLRDPEYGWTSRGHVLLGKFERTGFDGWPVDQQQATAASMELLANSLMAASEDEITGPDQDARRLLAWSAAQQAQMQ